MSSTDFGDIESEYAFFMAHSTEAERDLEAFAHELPHLGPRNRPLRVLDYGCGTGDFSERLLQLLAWPADLLELVLVELAAEQRQRAATRLARFSAGPIDHCDDLPVGNDPRFDLIVANHVLYYVNDLPEKLRCLRASLAPTGLAIVTMANWQNFLMQLWQVGYAALGQPVPFSAAEEVKAALHQEGIRFVEKTVAYEIRFPDTQDNRLKILRFLFRELLPTMGQQHLLGEFDRYAKRGQIEIATDCQHLVVKCGGA